ncbi:trypco2 family protein [Kocuria sabuli]|uniref:trypco2 family protein n=1 Tax=Kocuria sabuli TaxID=3071448 RepID=UPI0034D5D45F
MEAKGLASKVGLAQAIEALRAELTEAMNLAPEEGVRFEVGPVELTVEAAVTTAGGANAGIKWWLIEAGAEVSRESVSTQTLHLTLQPVRMEKDEHGIFRKVDLQIAGKMRRRQASPAG